MYPRMEARKALAERLHLPYSNDMQDWEWEVAEPARFDEFLNVYATQNLSEGERWSLMEVLVQCIEDMPSDSELGAAWQSLEPVLRSHAPLHGETIRYWSCTEATKPQELFRVSSAMRALLPKIHER